MNQVKRLKIGIFFGGSSREREVSFAGGRTVYDNLDKKLFDAIPIFVDSKGNLVKLKWEYVYRGTIRDFYPPVKYVPSSPNHFQIYSESINFSHAENLTMLNEVGDLIPADMLIEEIDFAFLALHGAKGEDGSIQGLLEFYSIPYSGSGILPSAIGINKALQKSLLKLHNFKSPRYIQFSLEQWKENPIHYLEQAEKEVGYPLVVKSSNQGSSIGITILDEGSDDNLKKAIDNSFFIVHLSKLEWLSINQVEYVRELSDIRSSLGFPCLINSEVVYHPENALTVLTDFFKTQDTVELKAIKGETEVIIEKCISGREFSCIVISDFNGDPIALPPTEIVKQKALFDYKSKYLPGLSRKVTPIDLPDDEIERIREECSRLFSAFGFDVYARIDGFYTNEGEIILNDPNTTSGMMPSSFFFHQAAEIGLNPSQFLTYLIDASLRSRVRSSPTYLLKNELITQLNDSILNVKKSISENKTVAIIMGGYSTERHISVESGRNIYEKLSSSADYSPIPVFLTGNKDQHQLYILPINMMLKDNADDIKQKIEDYNRHEVLNRIVSETGAITKKYLSEAPTFKPKKINYSDLPELCDEVFIALHGRPGEDGAIQDQLNKVHLPYNGSEVDSSQLTINKFETNKTLRKNGFLVADGLLISKKEFEINFEEVVDVAEEMGYPMIAKPADEGCSSAVKKIHNKLDLLAYMRATFRKDVDVDIEHARVLKLEPKEEFPQNDFFLLENFIDAKGADHFLEITGGLLTSYEDDKIAYEVFEASEALADGEVLSLAEKFLAGEGQNITPARYASDPKDRQKISDTVKATFEKVARTLNVEGYCRIDAFVRIFDPENVEVIIIEINSLPGMTPATCIYHQAAINGYKPLDFIDGILGFGRERLSKRKK
jgi:D-alanine-D-alanine ligase